jgi:tetratricopeptide (TPR) repeat protein
VSPERSVREMISTQTPLEANQSIATIHLLMDSALRHQQAGRLTEAEHLYHKILAIEPNHISGLHNLALIAHGRGQYELAATLFERAIAANDRIPQCYNSLGITLCALSRLEEAVACYRKALLLDPDYAEAHNNLGNALRSQGNVVEAIALFEHALALNPSFAEAYNNLGNALCALSRLEEAVACYRKALLLDPDYAEAHNNLGNALRSQGNVVEAIALFEHALALNPNLAEAYNNLGNALKDEGKPGEALVQYQRASMTNPNFVDALNSIGTSYLERGDLDSAVAQFNRVLALKPDHPGFRNNLANALKKQGKLGEAVVQYQRVLTLKPDYAEAHNNFANSLYELGELRDALRGYERALAIEPELALAHFNLGLGLLLDGQLERGWSEYDWRWRSVNKHYESASFAQPRWRGEILGRDKVLLLHAEQGLGDTIHFCRYVPLAGARARVALQVQRPLVGLLSSLSGFEEILRAGDPLPQFDAHCPLLSLPGAFKTEVDIIPAAIPYLEAESTRVLRWREILGGTGFRVGIVWQVNPLSETEQRRSIPLSHFATLAKIPNVRLISLQKTHGLDQLAALPEDAQIEILGPDFDNGPDAFLDTAAVMENLDLVITADTAAAHLAGALGRPTWVLLRHVPHWTWMLDRDDSPWYPSVRLFRQPRKDDWTDVFCKVENELRLISRS